MSNGSVSPLEAALGREALTKEVLASMGTMMRVFHRGFRQPREPDIFELTMPQCRVVLYLAEGPAHMSKIATALGVTLPSATGIVDRLVDRGLLAREEDSEDRRLVICALTLKGQQMATNLYQADLATLEGLVLALSVEELRVILQGFTILLKAASQQSAS